MKINVDIDITPEELRRFMGLPDVQGWQQLNLSPNQVRNISSVGKTPGSYGILLTVRRVTSAFDD